MTDTNIVRAWNSMALDYQNKHKIPVGDIYYGSRIPTENELGLLGDVAGKRTVELGCGGGQSTMTLAMRGAEAAGVDFSDEQIAFAKVLASQHGVEAKFVVADLRDLSFLPSGSQDIAFSVQALHFLDDLSPALAEAYRVLKPGGILVFSTDHPMWNAVQGGGFESDSRVLMPYFASSATWDVNIGGGESVPVTFYQHTVSEWYSAVTRAGFTVEALLEPEPIDRPDPWAEFYPMHLCRLVPTTLIIKARKPA